MCLRARSSLVSLSYWFNRGAEAYVCHDAELLHIQRQSCYLIGRDRLVADLAVEHPSCSKQHAAIQCNLNPCRHLGRKLTNVMTFSCRPTSPRKRRVRNVKACRQVRSPLSASPSFSFFLLNDRLYRPFIIDLESTNGTKVNDEAIPPARYYELHLNDGPCLLFLCR